FGKSFMLKPFPPDCIRSARVSQYSCHISCIAKEFVVVTTLEKPVRIPVHARATDGRLEPQRRRPGILVVDDNEMIRSMLGTFFGQQQIPYWMAQDGDEAVDLYRRHGSAIEFILMDVQMPVCDGPLALHRIRAHNPS